MIFKIQKKYIWKQNFVVFAILFCIVGIFYYSWLPYNRLGAETYLPSWLLAWSNHYFNLRTALPFFALSFLLQCWYAISGPTGREIKIPFWVFNIIFAAVLVCVVEGGQFFIAHRHPDKMDVFFGVLGSTFGCAIYYCIKNIHKLFFNRYSD
jgi:glycopeptide antibiotics resistance protein